MLWNVGYYYAKFFWSNILTRTITSGLLSAKSAKATRDF